MGSMGTSIFWGENMNNEEKLIQKYISLCDLMCKEDADYTTQKVRTHNQAMKKMQSLTRNLSSDISLADNVYAVLLRHEDSFIQQSAATECLSLNIHIEDALSILKQISKKGNRMAAMAAKRTLLIWNGQLNPNDPF